MAKLPTVRDHMDTRLLTLRMDAPILDGVDFLLENHITGAPVVDEAASSSACCRKRTACA